MIKSSFRQNTPTDNHKNYRRESRFNEELTNLTKNKLIEL